MLGTGLKKEDQTKSENSTIRGGDERDVEKELEKPATRLSLWIDNSIPLYLKMVIKNEVRKKFGSFSLAESQDSADVKVGLDFASKCYGSSEDSYQAPLILVPVVSFFTVCDGVAWEDFLKFWNGNPQSLSYITDQGGLPRLLIPEDIFNILEGVLGKCEGDVEILSQDSRDSLAYALNKEENSFSIIPFDWLEPGLKALNVDNMSVFDRKLNVREYPLALGIMVEGKNPDIVQELESNIGETGFSNRDIGELVTLNMTGVTALVRGTARKMEKYGVLYPAQDIAEILADADITHISNEIPFVEGCTGARDKDLVFCSKPDYIELIKYVGTDVIELTGNHMNDYGHEWMLYTLDLYDREGLAYFGGGRNLKESYKPAIFEISGNRIAFLGCNQFGPAYDWAGKETPGSTPPNYQDLENVVSDLKNKGYIVIFTFQYAETYDYRPIEQQVIDFRRMIEAGASIVSGSQSHHPMGVEITEDGFINYGLGNLFFDQMFSLGVRQGIIAKHVFYRQRHINTVLITTMLEDYCRPRLTTPEERAFLLRSIFEGSIRET
ncbi:MAG: CapA family protein [Actinobacteria bacterium]|nr:CapA family protein [Actinomycetota bacterium]